MSLTRWRSAALIGCAVSLLVGASLRARPQVSPDTVRIRGGDWEASGAVAVPNTSSILFVDDGDAKRVFWMRFDARGKQDGDVIPVRLDATVVDPEDIASDGKHFYVVGSQSQPGRRGDGFVRFDFDPSTRTVSRVVAIRDFGSWLAQQVPAIMGSGRGLFDGLNIEGLTWDAARRRWLFGLRSPMAGNQAVVVPVVMADPEGSFAIENLRLAPGGAIRLPLGENAIRGLGYDAATHRILILGGASSYNDAHEFRLFAWNGLADSVPSELGQYPARLKPEGVTTLEIEGRSRVVLVFDTGRYLVLN